MAKEKRLWFRALVQAHVSTLDALTKPSFPGTLVLVSGHVILYGWYLAAFEALNVENSEHMALLWQAAFTATLQAHIFEGPEQLALLSMKMSNEFHVNAHLAETFPWFARKLSLAMQTIKPAVAERLRFCETKGVRFNGGSVHRTLLLAATKYVLGLLEHFKSYRH